MKNSQRAFVFAAAASLICHTFALAATNRNRVLDGQNSLRSQAKSAQTKSQTPVQTMQNNLQLAVFEKQMAQMVNAARKNAKLSPLIWDEKLAQVARAHSLEMRDKKYFAHQSPTENLREPIDRYRAAFGQTPAVVAENVYRAWSSVPQKITLKTVRNSHVALMNSPHHREKILESRVQRVGIGIISNKNGDFWVTQMFSRPN